VNGNEAEDRIPPTSCGVVRAGPGRVGSRLGVSTVSGTEGAALPGPNIDHEAVYRQLPLPVLLLTPEFVIVDANEAYLAATGRTREQLVGLNVFDAFPDNPADSHASGVQDSKASLGRVLATGKADVRSFQKYDVEVPGSPGQFAARYWNTVNAPVFGPDGHIVQITHILEEITDRVRRFLEGLNQDEA
jgi:PAS domain-containing protein